MRIIDWLPPAHPTLDWAHNSDMYPDQESNCYLLVRGFMLNHWALLAGPDTVFLSRSLEYMMF